jgi:hypothetical protein
MIDRPKHVVESSTASSREPQRHDDGRKDCDQCHGIATVSFAPRSKLRVVQVLERAAQDESIEAGVSPRVQIPGRRRADPGEECRMARFQVACDRASIAVHENLSTDDHDEYCENELRMHPHNYQWTARPGQQRCEGAQPIVIGSRAKRRKVTGLRSGCFVAARFCSLFRDRAVRAVSVAVFAAQLDLNPVRPLNCSRSQRERPRGAEAALERERRETG